MAKKSLKMRNRNKY